MPTGFSIEKVGRNQKPFFNVYYTPTQDVSSALELGQQIASAEALIFGDTVDFKNVHAWIVGSNPPQFNNVGLSISGAIDANVPLSPWMCLSINFGVANSYPSYKYYRIQVDSAKVAGVNWSSTMSLAVADYLDVMSEFSPYLCNRDGDALGEPTYDGEIKFRNPKKAWYNRKAE